jgi:hypothetical protein
MQLSATPQVLGDPILLGQVIDNLLWNALKAIRRSRRVTGTIIVATQVDSNHVEVRVTDDGPGFVGPPEAFWARGKSGDATGTGLGLANVRETIHKHDGSCGIHSPPGEGASVWFQLPAIPQAPSRRRRVLLLEDDAFAGRAAQLRLGKVHEVVLALNPNMEGDLTAHHVAELMKVAGVKVTQIARGIPPGSQIEYASQAILSDAMKGRREL